MVAVSLVGPELFVVVGLALGFVAAGVIDAARLPGSQWQAAGQPKLLWILFMGVGSVACGLIGVFATVLYFVSIRPSVRRAPTAG